MKRFFVLLFMLSTLLQAEISQEQIAMLQTIRDVARTIPDKHGETYENTLSAICLTESSAGINVIGDFKKGTDITKASLGPMQIQVSTVRHVARNVKSLRWLNQKSDKQIANLLLTDLKLSAAIAAHYIVLLKNRRNDYMKTISGYNGGMENWTYVIKVMRHMKDVKALVKAGKLK
jgi:hypothetical protein